MTDEPEHIVLEQAVERCGVGSFHLKLLFMCGSIMMLDAMQIQILTFAKDGIKLQFGIDDAWFSVAASALFAGMFVGSIGAGFISDYHGRKVATAVAAVFIAAGGCCVCLSPWFGLLVPSYFVLGLGSGGLHPSAALFMEFLPTKHRLLGLIAFTSFFTTGLMLECLIACVLRDESWRVLTAVSLAPVLVSILLLPAWPESPRFLLVHGKDVEAVAILRRVARENNRQLPDEFQLILAPLTAADGVRVGESVTSEGGSSPLEEPQKKSFLNDVGILLEAGGLRRLTLILWVVWIVGSLGYYGLLMMAGSVSFGSLSTYASTAIITSSEYPSYCAQYFCGTELGRKRTFVLCCALLTVLFVVLHAVHDVAVAQLILFFVTRFVVTTLFDLAWMFTPEAYPTDIRSCGYGLCSAMARLSGIVAPYVALPLFDISPWGVTIAFSAMNLIGAVLSSNLPFDTKGRVLDERTPFSREGHSRQQV